MGDQSQRKTWALWVAVGLTCVWVGACAWLLSQAATCDVSGRFFQDHLFCLHANEIGDALAGAFAPVAFLWLAAAVFLQRSELEAQRQELRESRSIAAQQVEEARKNVRFIEEQTAMLQLERDLNSRRHASDEVEELMKLSLRACEKMARDFEVAVVMNIDDTDLPLWQFRLELPINGDLETRFKNCMDSIHHAWVYPKFKFDTDGVFVYSFRQAFREAHLVIERLIELQPKSTVSVQEMLNFGGLTRAWEAMEGLRTAMEERGRRRTTLDND